MKTREEIQQELQRWEHTLKEEMERAIRTRSFVQADRAYGIVKTLKWVLEKEEIIYDKDKD